MTDTSTALGWSFDPVSSRYRDTATGQYIASSDVTALRNDFLDAQAAQVQQLAADLAADSLTLSEWETAMRAVVQDTLGVEYVFGRGGLNMMAADDWQALGDLVASQFGYLNGFAQDIADGELSFAQLAARSVLYLGAGIGAYERGAAAAADIELPEYPGDSCEGMTSCRCYWDLEPSDDGGMLATWVAVGDSTTCEPCEANAAEWNPLAFGPDGVEKSMPHEFASTQVNLPGDLALDVLRYGATRMAAADLAPGDLKLELEPHITLKYGLHQTVTAADVAAALAGQGPISVTFGQLASFPEGDDGVPLYIEVDSPDLQRLHQVLVDALPNTTTHAGYTPHVTIAYIQPGSEPNYLSDPSPLAGRSAVFHSVIFSDTERNHTSIPLTGGAQPMTRELLRAEISKIDDEQQIVFGWASVSVGKDGALLVDRQDDVIFPEDLEHAAYDFVLNSRQSDTAHDQVTKAHLVESMVFTAEKMALMGIAFTEPIDALRKSESVCLWWTGFFVPDAHIWKGVKDGDYAAFSIGGSAIREPMPESAHA